MKLVGTVLLWMLFGLAVLAIAWWVRRRLRRGERVLLSGRFAPWLVRMVAIALVAFGWSPSEAAEPDPTCQSTKTEAGGLPKKAVEPKATPLEHTRHPRDFDLHAADATRAFNAARELARRTDITSPADVEALLRHFRDADRAARAQEAQVATAAEIGPVSFRPWMSKAGPRPEELRAMERRDDVFEKKLATADTGTWEREATIDLTIASGGGTLHRYGAHALPWKAAVRLRRFDVIVAGEVPLVLTHADLGAITLPARTALTAWNLPQLLGTDARTAIDALVTAAARCDAVAHNKLARILPAAHDALRANGAPELKLLLALFEE